MPLFEVASDEVTPPIGAGSARAEPDNSARLVAVAAHNHGFAREVLAALDGLVGEQVFPVAQGDGVTQPALLALDASGVPVAVEIVEVLDQAALLRALGHAGSVGRMSRGQLAAQYPGGLSAFGHHLQHYLDSVPFRCAITGNRGARLIIVCTDAEPEVLNAVDFLNRPELPIKVLRANTLEATDGHRFVDVSPLVVNPNSAPDRPVLVGQAAVSRLRIAAGDASDYRRAVSRETAAEDWGNPVAADDDSAPALSDGLAPASVAVGSVGSAPDIATAHIGQGLGSRKARRLARAREAGGLTNESAAAIVPSAAPPTADVAPIRGDVDYEFAYSEYAVGGPGTVDASEPVVTSKQVDTAELVGAAEESRRERRLALQPPGIEHDAVAGQSDPDGVESGAIPGSAANDSLADNDHHAITALAIERAKAALSNADNVLADADSVLAKLESEVKLETLANNFPTRKSLRAQKPVEALPTPIEFTGVFAKGTDAADPLSWDTTNLPVIARPITTSIPITSMPTARGKHQA